MLRVSLQFVSILRENPKNCGSMHSVENHYAPLSFYDTWTKNSVNHGDRPLRNTDDCKLPNPETELFTISPLYTPPLEWNSMDDNKFIRNIIYFKTA